MRAASVLLLGLLVEMLCRPRPAWTHDTTTISGCAVHVDGCSIPCDFPFFYKTKFTPACNKHDVCYSCGQLYGWSRNNCDGSFHKDMKELCDSSRKKRFVTKVWQWIKGLVISEKSRCKGLADFYHKSVELFGEKQYLKKSPLWCHSPCVRSAGDPKKTV